MKHAAFSLIELSIVLVILGLLTGGILAGKSLIRASEIRAGTAQVQTYITSLHTFRDKYFGVPGDLTNAVAFWGAAAGTSTDNYTTGCYATASTTTATCNGNGDGQIVLGAGGESFRAWQHLSNAGLLEGTYNGTSDAPLTKWSATRWNLNNLLPSAGNTNNFAADFGNALYPSSLSVMKPEEAWNVDTKIDDGIPSKGRVLSARGTALVPCTTRAGQAVDAVLDAAALYDFSQTGNMCRLIFARAI